MHESAQFLESLNHSNPERPRFSIKPGTYPMLEIELAGQRMEVPIAEILAFARRWEADWAERKEAIRTAGRLPLYPYSIMCTRLDDPDCRDQQWSPKC